MWIGILGGLSVFLLAYGALASWGLVRQQRQQVAERVSLLSSVEAKKRRIHQHMLGPNGFQTSFSERVILPIAIALFQRIKLYIPLGGQMDWVQEHLTYAGYKKSSLVPAFLGIQCLSVLVVGGSFFLQSALLSKTLMSLPALFFGGIGAVFGYLLPMMVLSAKVGSRQVLIQKSLPDFLELLVICVEAGLSMDSAILKIIQHQTPTPNTLPWREELMRYLGDIEFGMNRKQAMLQLGERTGVEDVKTFVNALIMAYEMGASVAQTLRVQCDTLRNKRLQRAEEKAQKIPVKMVPPIYIFLFPAIFVSIFGPLTMILVQNLGGLIGKGL